MPIGCLPENFKLTGKNFLANIAMPPVDSATGLTGTMRDPRKMRLKPDAYMAIVEQVGDKCKKVRVGDRIVVERWTWLQLDVDEERILASEKDVLILNDDTPNDGISVIEMIQDQKMKSENLQLEHIREGEKQYIFGKIVNCPSGIFKQGDLVWLAKYDRNQWQLGKNRFVFKEDNDFMLVRAESSEKDNS